MRLEQFLGHGQAGLAVANPCIIIGRTLTPDRDPLGLDAFDRLRRRDVRPRDSQSQTDCKRNRY